MKKTLLVPLAICAIALTTVPIFQARANVLYTETFSYSDGALTNVSAPLWVAHSGGGATPVQVSSGQISLVQGSGSREDVNRPTGVTMGAGETWYAGFDLTVTGGSSTAVYFAHFLETSSTFGSRVWLLNGAGVGGDYILAVNNSSTAPASGWASPLTFGNNYRVIVSYDFDTGAGNLWINPTTIGDPSISTTGFAADAMFSFGFRQAAGDSVQVIDNLVVATSFAEALAVPEPSTIALGAVGAAGLALFRRRKA